MLKLYENIKTRREELGMSQDDLAALTGYKGRAAISAIELGKTDLTITKIKTFARALRTTPGELMGDDGTVDAAAAAAAADFKVITLFNTLNDKNKKIIMQTMQLMIDTQDD